MTSPEDPMKHLFEEIETIASRHESKTKEKFTVESKKSGDQTQEPLSQAAGQLPIIPGGRALWLSGLAIRLKKLKLLEGEIKESLLKENEIHCRPPLKESEIDLILKDPEKYQAMKEVLHKQKREHEAMVETRQKQRISTLPALLLFFNGKLELDRAALICAVAWNQPKNYAIRSLQLGLEAYEEILSGRGETNEELEQIIAFQEGKRQAIKQSRKDKKRLKKSAKPGALESGQVSGNQSASLMPMKTSGGSDSTPLEEPKVKNLTDRNKPAVKPDFSKYHF